MCRPADTRRGLLGEEQSRPWLLPPPTQQSRPQGHVGVTHTGPCKILDICSHRASLRLCPEKKTGILFCTNSVTSSLFPSNNLEAFQSVVLTFLLQSQLHFAWEPVLMYIQQAATAKAIG